jgi:hypothetical protein
MTALQPSSANRPLRIGVVLLATALAFAVAPARADAFRCGVHIVDPGMQIVEVLDACGDPVQVTHSSIQRPSVIWIHGRPYLDGGVVDVSVETWIYNFGSLRLMQQLRFEDGVLVEVIPLDHGYEHDSP